MQRLDGSQKESDRSNLDGWIEYWLDCIAASKWAFVFLVRWLGVKLDWSMIALSLFQASQISKEDSLPLFSSNLTLDNPLVISQVLPNCYRKSLQRFAAFLPIISRIFQFTLEWIHFSSHQWYPTIKTESHKYSAYSNTFSSLN